MSIGVIIDFLFKPGGAALLTDKICKSSVIPIQRG